MKILITYYSETGNTAKIAEAICEGLKAKGHEADLMAIADAAHMGEIAPDTLSAYDLVFLGSACHDADLAMPVQGFLGRIPASPGFKLAGFVTHACYAPEGGDRRQRAYRIWVSRCAQSLRQACQEKGIDFVGYYSCQGAPSPPIEQFLHNNIVTDEDEWQVYIQEARKHPDEDDLRQAREFAQAVLTRL